MNSATTSIVGSLGAGSGVDMVRLAGDLSAARFAPQVKQLEQRSELMEARISAAAKLKSQMTQLAAALGERVRQGALAPTATVGNTAVATATVAPGAKGSESHMLEVTRLATAQVLASKLYPAADTLVGAGQLTIRFGEVAGTAFLPAERPPVAIDVGPGDTLTTLADKINAQGGGLTAYVAARADGAQLVIRGADGAVNGFTLSTTGPDSSGTGAAPGQIGYLDWRPGNGAVQPSQAAGDAAFLLNGVPMSSPDNRVEQLPGGLALTLTGTNTGAPTRIGIDPPVQAIGVVMKDLQAALNDVATQLQESARAIGGELGNDGGARALKRGLLGLATAAVMPNAPPGTPRTLGDLGLTMNRDGLFELDEGRLNQVLTSDAVGAAAMFTPGLFGVFATVDRFARTAGLGGDPGSLGGSIARYQRQQERIGDRLERLADRQDRLRAQLTRQFTQSDSRVSASQSTLSFLQNQMAAWNRSDR